MARSLSQPHIPWDRSRKHRFFEMLLHLIHHSQAQICPCVKHGQQYPLNLQMRIKGPLYPLNGIHQGADAFQCIIFALNRNQNSIRRGHCVQCQQAKTRRTIDENEIIILPNRSQKLLQVVFPLIRANQFHFCSRQLNIRSKELQFFNHCILQAVFHGGPAHQGVVNGISALQCTTKPAGRVPLRIQVDHQRLFPHLRQAGCQIYGSCSLSNTAFLVRNRNNLCHFRLLPFALSQAKHAPSYPFSPFL